MEVPFAALEVCFVYSEGNPVFSPPSGSKSITLRSCCPDPKFKYDCTPSADKTVPEYLSTELLPSLPYSSCDRTSQCRGGLDQESSDELKVLLWSGIGIMTRREGSGDQVGEGGFFDQAGFSDATSRR